MTVKRPELVKEMDAAWLAWWKECTGSEWTGRNAKEHDPEEWEGLRLQKSPYFVERLAPYNLPAAIRRNHFGGGDGLA